MKPVLKPFTLTLPVPLKTARGEIKARSGTHLYLDNAVGEIVTWPGFGSDNPSLVDAESERVRDLDVPDLDSLAAIDDWVQDTSQVPEIRAALELALLDRLAMQRDVTVAALLDTRPVDMVRLHRLVNDENDAPLHAHALKMKVGGNLENDCRRVQAVRNRIGPETPIRLDANGSWSVPTAIDALARFTEANVEFIEQPTPPGDDDALAQVRSESSIPVAADESIRNAECLSNLLERQAIDVAVLKPAFVGGLITTKRLAEQAEEQGVRVVITHALGSIVERSGALHVAAALNLKTACGLSHPFTSEVGTGYTVAGGIAHLPEASGLGIDRSRLG